MKRLLVLMSLWMIQVSAEEVIGPRSGIIEYLQEVFDGDGGQERYRDVVSFYSRFDYWDSLPEQPDTLGYQYNPSEFQLRYNLYKDASIANEASLLLEHSQDTTYRAYVYIYPGSGDNELLNKPLIIGDAFDPLDLRGVEEMRADKRYQNLTSLNPNDSIQSPRDLGYDVVFVNFKQGGGRLELNSGLLAKTIEVIQQRSPAPIVVAGVSMSGILARMALLYGERANNVQGRFLFPQVKGWVSIDSPQEGAVIGPLQRALWSMIVDEGIARGLDFLGEDNQLALQYFTINVPGAHQMLKTHYYVEHGDKSDHFLNFQKSLKKMGNFPSQFGVGIAYSNFYMPNPEMDKRGRQEVKKLVISDADYSYSLEAGGPDGATFESEFEPGSTGNWYYELFEGVQGAYMRESKNNPGPESFKGTFIPIRSALALGDVPWRTYGQTPELYENGLDNRQVGADSEFDRVYWMSGPNQYASEFFGETLTEEHPDELRYEHMVFDAQLVNQIAEALIMVESQAAMMVSTSLY